MNRRIWTALAVTASMTLALGGCALGDTLSAVTKILNSQLSTLSTSEIIALAALADTVSPDFAGLSEDDAAIISEFLTENNLNSIEDVENAINNSDELVIPEGLEELLDGIKQQAGA